MGRMYSSVHKGFRLAPLNPGLQGKPIHQHGTGKENQKGACLPEHDGFIPADQYAVFHMVAQPARQHVLLDVASITHHVFNTIAVVNAYGVLLDDGSRIQFGGDVMAARAYQFYAAQISLVIGFGAGE